MPTPSSGTISYANIAQTSLGSSYSAFLTTNIGINLYNRGGTYIPNVVMGGNSNVPTSIVAGSNTGINLYYNVWGYKRLTFTLTTGTTSYAVGKTAYNISGFSVAYGTALGQNSFNTNAGAFGSISANSYVTPRGTFYIVGFNYDSQFGNMLVLSSGATPTDDDQNFIAVWSGSASTLYSRSGRSSYNTSSLCARYLFGGTQMFSTNGPAYSCYINYYG